MRRPAPTIAGWIAVKRFRPADTYVHIQHGRWEHYPYALWTPTTRTRVGWVAPV